ncbi:MAG: alkaline phosphatase [Clostridia bacterium]|nr:alkaline phosphatase [Clostridia bacterium]MBR2907015.1 alkaline phosphatase [Clostridia bacterium]
MKKAKTNLRVRALALSLVFLLLLSLLSGCKGGGTDPSTNPPESTAPETEPVLLNLIQDGSTEYKIICAENASEEIQARTLALHSELLSRTGVSFGISTDFYNHYKDTLPEKACEILIGDTNRAESAEMKALIGEREFVIAEKNDRIVILGGSEEKTLEAVDYFLENYLTEDKNIAIMQGSQYLDDFRYHLGTITIDGVSLAKYTVVIPKNAKTLFPYYAALNLIDYLRLEAGITLPLVYDDTPETDYEIVIGLTTRKESLSAENARPNSDQYILKKVGTSVYMYGKSYMVGGAVSEFVNSYLKPEAGAEMIDIVGLPESNLTRTFTFPKKATSAILLIGDGMGQKHIDSTYSKRSDTFLAEYLENVGTCTTFPYGGSATSTGYTDSAASATALATGYKTKNNYLGVDHNNKTLKNVRELASEMGAKTAVLTSDVITGATPAGFLCHHNSRKATDTLQQQINQLRRKDKNLLYSSSVNKDKDQLLPETREILYTLANEGETYFAMIEEAYIDKESHNNDIDDMQTCVLRYNDVIGYCIQFIMLHPETALVVTADHECGGLTLNSDGSFSYTGESHTNAKVPVFSIGPGTDIFKGVTVDNTDIGKFLGSIYTDKYFGDPSLD